MKTTFTTLVPALIVLALGSTASFGAEPQVNCDTAAQDIAHLESEKQSALEQAEKGVTSIMPSTAALHLITGTQQESKEIASGEYNARIDAHIAKIKSTCGIDQLQPLVHPARVGGYLLALLLGGCSVTHELEEMPQELKDVAALDEPMAEVATSPATATRTPACVSPEVPGSRSQASRPIGQGPARPRGERVGASEQRGRSGPPGAPTSVGLPPEPRLLAEASGF